MSARTALARSTKALPPLRSAGLAAGRTAVFVPFTRVTGQPRAVASPPPPSSAWSSVRSFRTSSVRCSKETGWAGKGPIVYSELKSIASQPTGEVTIIDVREPDEVAAGMIPSAVNVPLTQFESAFNANKDANFQQNFAFPRPGFNDPLVFYCRSGKRSAQAQEIAKRNGWTKYVASDQREPEDVVSLTSSFLSISTRNYEGSWLDWVSHEEKGGQ